MPTLTATAEPNSRPPRVVLDLVMSDLSPVPTSATITRLDPDGNTRAVRQADPATLVSGTATVFDYESQFGAAVSYTATAGGTSVTSNSVTLDPANAWLRHPSIPSLSLELPRVHEDTDGQRTYASTRSVFTPLGRATPIVLTEGVRRSPETTLIVHTVTLAEKRRLIDLVRGEAVLLLTTPPAFGWDLEHEYVSIGDVTVARLPGSWGELPNRYVTLPYTVVDRPAGGVIAQYTFADVLAEHPTFADVRQRYNNFGDLLANQRNDVTPP